METVIALKEAMQRVGIRNADVARACDISPQAVHQWFAKGTVSRHHLMTAARLCGTTLDQLEGKPAQAKAPVMDLETLKRAVQHVKEVMDRDGLSKEITPEVMAEMIVFS